MLPVELENKKEDIRLEVERLGAELVDVGVRRAGGRMAVTIVADKAGGITLDDCARVNAHLGLFLDKIGEAEGGFFSAPYTLEVNSPGLDRPLRSQRDFERAAGEVVRVTYKDSDDKVVSWTGQVREVRDGLVWFAGPAESGVFQAPLDRIVRALREIKI